MRSTPNRFNFVLKPPSGSITGKLRGFHIATIALVMCAVSAAHADATLTYELSAADGSKAVKKFSIARFFARIDDPADKDRYLLYQAGKFFPLFSVDQAESNYTRLTPEVTAYMSPHSREHHGADQTADQSGTRQPAENRKKSTPKLKPTKKTRKVAGIECHVVNELHEDKPAVEHCMANSARLAIADRELITMARTFEMGRNRGFGWLGIATEDEEFISVQSKDLRNDRVLTLTAVSTKPLEQGYLRIPREYTEIKPDTDEEAAAEAKSEPEPE